MATPTTSGPSTEASHGTWVIVMVIARRQENRSGSCGTNGKSKCKSSTWDRNSYSPYQVPSLHADVMKPSPSLALGSAPTHPQQTTHHGFGCNIREKRESQCQGVSSVLSPSPAASSSLTVWPALRAWRLVSWADSDQLPAPRSGHGS